MEFLKYSLLGLVQGLTEFLPVSSSGHLAITKQLFGEGFTDLGLTYDILLHVATLVAVFVVYWRDIVALITGFFGLIGDLFRRRLDLSAHPEQRLVLLVILASVPAAVVGVLFDDAIEALFSSHFILVGFMLLLTGVELMFSDRIPERGLTEKDLAFPKAFVPGAFQALALFPGLSRSGSTITGALLTGAKREFAVKFSFLMSIPVILGSALVDVVGLIRGEGTVPAVGPALVGMVIAAIVGYLSIRFMLKLISNKRFHYFAYYCFAVGAAVIIWQLCL